MQTERNIISCRGLSKAFGYKKALDGVDLELKSGRITGLLGPNGSGKTTLMKLAGGLLIPDCGSILIDGKEPGICTKSMVSYLPDHMFFADWMRVRDLVHFFRDFYEDFDSLKAENMLQELRVAPGDRVRHLSKGTKEKVQLALTMSRQAKLYLLDEPIGGVDPAARDYILKTILTNYAEDASILISTHLISDIEKVLDEVVFLQNGKVIRYDTVDHIRETEGKSVDQLFRESFSVQAEGVKCLEN